MLTLDRDRTTRKHNPTRARRAERQYAVQLRKIARHVGDIINGFPPGDPEAVSPIETILRQYAEVLGTWATRTAASMLYDVSARDAQTWFELSNEMSKALRDEIRNAPTGELMREMLAEQVTLIKSLPLEAAQRVHDLTLKGIEDGARAKEIAKEIARSGEVSMNRANLIARTEVARTAAKLTQARAEHIGSTQYIWRTSGDSDVRPGHKAMNGKVFAWDNPPEVDEGGRIMRHHPGEIWNCRCYAEPIIPSE